MMVDPDTNATDPTSVTLHTVVSDLTLSDPSSHKILAKYLVPEHSGHLPHKYSLLLFEQPDKFIVPEHYHSSFALHPKHVTARANFPLQKFIKQTGLGKPVAANWFQEGAKRGASTSSTAPVNTKSTTSAAKSSSDSVTSPSPTPTPHSRRWWEQNDSPIPVSEVRRWWKQEDSPIPVSQVRRWWEQEDSPLSQ